MHGYKVLHGGDLNKNCNFNLRKIVMHGHTILIWGDINGNEHFRKEKLFFDIFRSKDKRNCTQFRLILNNLYAHSTVGCMHVLS